MHRSVIVVSRALSMGLLTFGALTLAASAGSSCSDSTADDGTTTTGKHITLATRAQLEGSPTFTNAFSWQITLSKLDLSIGGLYYFDGYPIESAGLEPFRAPASQKLGWGVLLGPFAPSVAHAHPGHYKEGEALGEMLTPTSADLVAGPVDLADADAVTGTYRSVRYTFGSPPSGPLASALGSNLIVLEGTATKGAMTKVFRLTATPDDTYDESGKPQIEGCTFDETDVEDDGVVTMTVNPETWLDQAEFDDVEESADTKPVDVPRDNRAFNAFARGIKKSTAFHFSYAKQ